jgi:von Willebrand factor type A domain.
MHPDYHDLFQRLITVRDEIINCAKVLSVSKRCNLRVDIYQHLWRDVMEVTASWDSDDSPEGLSVMEGGTAGTEECEDDQHSEIEDCQDDQLDCRENEAESHLRLMQHIKDILKEQEERSLNEHIEGIADEEKSGIVDTCFVKSGLPCRIDPDAALVSRLKRIFRQQRTVRSRRYHYQRALPTGKIDGRRLYRFALDGRLFRQREYIYHDNTRNIAILVDGSASMTGGLPGGGKDWTQTERVFASLCEAIKGTGNSLDVFAYSESGGVCEVSCLAYNNQLYTVRPGGRTPTGQAIVATALKLPKDKPGLIIHVTDGEPNCGLSVKKGLEFCDRTGVEIVTIGAYYDEEMKATLEKQYENRAILVESLELLPERLEETLRTRLLN